MATFATRLAWTLTLAGAVACIDLSGLEPRGDDAAVAALPPEAGADEAGSLPALDAMTDVSPIDAGEDTAPIIPPPPLGSFSIGIGPAHITVDQGETATATVQVLRGANFSGAVDVTIEGATPSVLTVAPSVVTVAASESLGTVSFNVAGGAVTQDLTLTASAVAATNPALKAQATMTMRIGSVLLDTTAATGTLMVPAYANKVLVKAWGGGGGAGGNLYSSTYSYSAAGRPGGGGGFIAATLTVTPSTPLTVSVGQGGGATTSAIAPFGGGGGGLTSLSQLTTTLLIVGGGGGGAGASAKGTSSCSAVGMATDGNGAAGGGANGENTSGGNRSATVNNVGKASGAGGTDGSALTGGSAGSPDVSVPGGAQGGGSGGSGQANCMNNSGGGGGGAGWFGGAGGAQGTLQSALGGGGGSGFIIAGALDVTRLTGTGSTPGGASDPDFLPTTASGGAVGTPITKAPHAGSPGRVIVRLPKP